MDGRAKATNPDCPRTQAPPHRSGAMVLSTGMARYRSRVMVLSYTVARSNLMVLSQAVARSPIMVLSAQLAVMPDVLTPAFHRLGFSVDADPDLASRLWRWPCMT